LLKLRTEFFSVGLLHAVNIGVLLHIDNALWLNSSHNHVFGEMIETATFFDPRGSWEIWRYHCCDPE